jgi:hypothetical protein
MSDVPPALAQPSETDLCAMRSCPGSAGVSPAQICSRDGSAPRTIHRITHASSLCALCVGAPWPLCPKRIDALFTSGFGVAELGPLGRSVRYSSGLIWMFRNQTGCDSA